MEAVNPNADLDEGEQGGGKHLHVVFTPEETVWHIFTTARRVMPILSFEVYLLDINIQSLQLNLHYIRKSLEFIKDMQSGFDPWVIIVSCNTIYNAQVGLARWTFLQRSSCNFCYFTSLFPFVIRFHDTSKWLYTRVSSNSSRLIKNNKTKW